MKKRLWRTWGASRIGPGHLRLGLPNQDAWLAQQFNWGEVVVVSDGLGSRPKSDLGARAACYAVVEAARLYHNCARAPVQELLRLIHALWLLKIGPHAANDCCATCLFVIRRKGQCLLGQLGDGMIAVCGDNSEQSILLQADKQDSFANLTHSLGAAFNPEHWQTGSISTEQCQAVVLCTDGIADDLLPSKQSQFARELVTVYGSKSPRQIKQDLDNWLKHWPVPGHSDDKTIACLYHKERVRKNE